MSSSSSESVDIKFRPFHEKMKRAGIGNEQIAVFKEYYRMLLDGEKGEISRKEIEPVDQVLKAEELEGYEADGMEALSSTVVIKLNGGLGTSMGLNRAKSLLKVKDGYSFLDIILKQIKSIRKKFNKMIPLVFMNSDGTYSDTEKIVKSSGLTNNEIPAGFMQSKVPKIQRKTLLPVTYPDDPDLEWCPPGHGDIYHALKFSGLLDRLLDKGYRFAFVSNSDNLGATLDEQILGYFAKNLFPFMMEVAERTKNDRKGGHIARKRTGGWLLREIAQCPSEEIDEFQDISIYKYFNTNTIWLNLEAVHDILHRSGNRILLPLIVNKKNVNPKDVYSEPVYQLESAMGAAIGLFPGATVIEVQRNRFLPVKTCQDLIGLWSDAYSLTDDFRLVLSPTREGPVITKLDSKYFGMIHQLEERFPFGPPSLVACREWMVSGNVVFGRGVRLEGHVEIYNHGRKVLRIPDGMQIKNKTITVQSDRTIQ